MPWASFFLAPVRGASPQHAPIMSLGTENSGLQAWVGHSNEKWLFSVMPLDGVGGKQLYSTPYDYEMSTRQLIRFESTVEAWHARVQEMYEKNSHRWPTALAVPPHWDMPIARTVRAERIEQLLQEDSRYAGKTHSS